MTEAQNISLSYSPIGDHIIVGRLNKQRTFYLERRDATPEFIGALIEMVCGAFPPDGTYVRHLMVCEQWVEVIVKPLAGPPPNGQVRDATEKKP